MEKQDPVAAAREHMSRSGGYDPKPKEMVRITSAWAEAATQIIRHTWDETPERVKVKLEKNTKGYQWEITYCGPTVDATLGVIREANEKLQAEYGEPKP